MCCPLCSPPPARKRVFLKVGKRKPVGQPRSQLFCPARRFEILVQPLPQLKARTVQAYLHSGGGESKRLGRFCRRKSFHVAKLKDDPVPRRELTDGRGENALQLLLRIALFRGWPPILKFNRESAFFSFNCVIDGHFLQTASAHLHPTFVDCDANK